MLAIAVLIFYAWKLKLCKATDSQVKRDASKRNKKRSKKKCDFFFVGSIEAKPETAVTSLTCQNSIYFGRGREREKEEQKGRKGYDLNMSVTGELQCNEVCR